MKGKTWRFRVQGNMDAKSTSGSHSTAIRERVLAVVTWRVLDVDADGVADVAATIDPVNDRVGGRWVKPGKPVHERLRIARDGRMLAIGTVGFGRVGGRGGIFVGLDQLAPLLPSKGVNPGDTWHSTFRRTVPGAGATLELQGDGTLVHYQSVDNVTTAVVTNRLSMPVNLSVPLRSIDDHTAATRAVLKKSPGARFVDSGHVTASATSWIDPVLGQLVQSNILTRFDLSVRTEGFPTSSPAVDARVTGTVSFHVTQMRPEKAGPAHPEQAARDRLRLGLAATNVYFTADQSFAGLTGDVTAGGPPGPWRPAGAAGSPSRAPGQGPSATAATRAV